MEEGVGECRGAEGSTSALHFVRSGGASVRCVSNRAAMMAPAFTNMQWPRRARMGVISGSAPEKLLLLLFSSRQDVDEIASAGSNLTSRGKQNHE